MGEIDLNLPPYTLSKIEGSIATMERIAVLLSLLDERTRYGRLSDSLLGKEIESLLAAVQLMLCESHRLMVDAAERIEPKNKGLYDKLVL